jgi:hypothetical protein
MKHERCIGTLHGPVGDCLRPVAVGLFCFGYLDRDESVPLREGLELVPMLFPVCETHRTALADWAEHLWGQVANAMWVPPEAFGKLKRMCEMDADPLVMSPNPADAVAISA